MFHNTILLEVIKSYPVLKTSYPRLKRAGGETGVVALEGLVVVKGRGKQTVTLPRSAVTYTFAEPVFLNEIATLFSQT